MTPLSFIIRLYCSHNVSNGIIIVGENNGGIFVTVQENSTAPPWIESENTIASVFLTNNQAMEIIEFLRHVLDLNI